jgi:hypothetical protein
MTATRADVPSPSPLPLPHLPIVIPPTEPAARPARTVVAGQPFLSPEFSRHDCRRLGEIGGGGSPGGSNERIRAHAAESSACSDGRRVGGHLWRRGGQRHRLASVADVRHYCAAGTGACGRGTGRRVEEVVRRPHANGVGRCRRGGGTCAWRCVAARGLPLLSLVGRCESLVGSAGKTTTTSSDAVYFLEGVVMVSYHSIQLQGASATPWSCG